jgi:plastocyanin
MGVWLPLDAILTRVFDHSDHLHGVIGMRAPKMLLLLTTGSILGCVPLLDAPGDPGANLPMTNEIVVQDNGFSPPATHIVGDLTVTWIWKGIREHNVTFEDGVGSSMTQLTGTHQRTFNPGVGGPFRFPYRCTLHTSDFNNGEVGVVIVQ